MPVDLLKQPVNLLDQDEQPGVLDYIGAVPQTLANMATGTVGMAASGLAGVWDLISGGDFETATKRINEVSKSWSDALRIDLSKSGQDIESWIGDRRGDLVGYTKEQLIKQGVPEIHANNLAEATVDTTITLLPFAPKGTKGVVKGASKGITKGLDTFATQVAALKKPAPLGVPPIMPAGGPVQRVAPPPMANRMYNWAQQRMAPVAPPVVPPMIPPAVPPQQQQSPAVAPTVPSVTRNPRPVASAPVNTYNIPTVAPPKNIPNYRHNALSNLIDTPYYRAIRVAGGENHPLVTGMRKLETDTILGRQKYQPLEIEYATALDKLSRANRKAYKDAILTGDNNRALSILSSSKAVKGQANAKVLMDKVNVALDERFNEVVASGVDQTYIPGFHPRVILDPRGFANAFEKMLARKGKVGYAGIDKVSYEVQKLTDQVQKNTITWEQYSKEIDKILTGDAYRKIVDPKGSHSKERTIKVVPKELQKYYANPGESLAEYFTDTARILAEREYLGKGWKNVDEGIGNRIATELANKTINEKQAREFKKILEERFAPSTQQGGSKAVRFAKDIGYAGTIGNALSTAVQVLDVIPSAIKFGVLRTLGGASRHILGKTGLMGRLDPRKIGLYETAHEIGRSNFLDTVLKYAPFKMGDRFGKGTILNAARSKYKSMAKSKRADALLERKGWRQVYRDPAEWTAFKDALKEGDFNNRMVQEVAIAELLDLQPIAISSMPISYLRHPNGRIFYMLKTWAIKQINSVRETYRKGDKVRATALMAGVIGSNMAAPYVRDLATYMFGTPKEREETTLPEETLAAFLRAVFADKYAIDKAVTSGKAAPLVGGIMSFPAADIVFGVIKEVIDWWNDEWDWEDSKVKRYIPFYGAIDARLEK